MEKIRYIKVLLNTQVLCNKIYTYFSSHLLRELHVRTIAFKV